MKVHQLVEILQALPGHKEVKFLPADGREGRKIKEVEWDYQVDTCVHLKGVTRPAWMALSGKSTRLFPHYGEGK